MADRTRWARTTLVAVLVVAVLGVVGIPAPTAGQGVPGPTESAYRVDTVTPDLRSLPGGRLVARADGVEPFTTIGASFTSASGGEARVRAHLPAGWSEWFELHHGHGDGPVTDPVWVGDDADGYEVRLPADAAGVELHLVRATGEPVALAPAEAAAEATTARAGNPAPPIRRRGSWGAAPYRGRIVMNPRITRGVVHHTVNTNGYSQAQVPSMLRSIQSYHQGPQRNWPDIAYNFVVDRFGTIWEARARSYDRPVRVSASSGTTIGTVTVAYLGDGSNQPAPSGSVRAMGRLLGWKLRKHGLRPTRNNIVAHTEIGQTSCPGAALRRQVPTVERIAIQGNPPPGPFYDVPWTNRHARAVDWVADRNIIPGFPDFTFRPLRKATRAAAIAWIWGMAGRPSGSSHPFTDVPANALYREALEWASDEGIVRGLTPTRFGPGRIITRRAFIDTLWRWVGSPRIALDHAYDDAGPRESLDWASATGLTTGRNVRPTDGLTRIIAAAFLFHLRPYTDVGGNHLARRSVDWARAHAIVSGYPNHTFRPNQDVNRRQASNWIWAFMDRPGAGPVDPAPAKDALDRATAVTWLWEAAGSPPPNGPAPYDDVTGEPHEDAATWAEETRLFPDWTGNTSFGAAETVTRSELVRALYRLAGRSWAWADPDAAPGTVLFD